MRKNRFYVILAVLTIIFLFSFSALCNQCSAPDEEKIDVGDQEKTDEASDSDKDDAQDSDDGSDKDDSESQDDEDADADDENEDADVEAPTINLVIYEGPIYSTAGDGVCYYRIRADVTGKPNPDVVFSKDDSDDSWGSKKVQININDPSDSYTLTATATNSEDSDSDSITLTWGCNRPPVISEITLMGNHFTGVEYDFSAAATDPDGDTLSYSWSVEGGSLNSSTGNPIKWTMPGTVGNYHITVEVDDGNGGTAAFIESVEVLPALPPPVINIDVLHIPSEGGHLEKGGFTNAGGCLYIGDTNNNKVCEGYMSYNITGLAGATVTDAKLTFTLKQDWGDPTFYTYLFIHSLSWGTNPISQGLSSLSGVGIQGVNSSGSGNFTCTFPKLKEELQKAINDGKTRFQIRIFFTGPQTDNNNDWDGWEYDQDNAVLNVTGHH
ncbi:MAG TPA: hypothetical protein DCP02_01660 [Actinobacteria bacterium]|nr:hypothetical protein [Actinomycetota bacterium]